VTCFSSHIRDTICCSFLCDPPSVLCEKKEQNVMGITCGMVGGVTGENDSAMGDGERNCVVCVRAAYVMFGEFVEREKKMGDGGGNRDYNSEWKEGEL
jgi:hypothetical protein